MEACPFHVNTQSEEELWQQMELHARLAHGEDPGQWTDDDRKHLKTLIKNG
jgi:predicted small metal-binding protein